MGDAFGKAAAWIFKRVVWTAVLAALVLGSIGLTRGLLLWRSAAAAEAIEPLPVETATARLQDSYRAVRRFPGRINAAQVSDVGFQVGGEIVEVLVEVGDSVAAGDAVARLDPERLRLRLEELAAARSEAEASLKRAEAALGRTLELFADGFATQQNVDDATAERDGFRARVRQLARSRENAEVDLNDATLRAPFGGVVVGRYLDAGATVTAGQPVLRINEKGSLDAIVGVPARFARRIGVGDEFEVASTDVSARARVTGVGDEIDAATQTVAIRLEIREDPGFIPGGLVRLELDEERRGRGAWAPALALLESYRGLWSVYVVEDVEDGVGTVARKDVEIIHIGNERVFVRGALEDGDRIVAAAPFRFVPGQKVRIVSDQMTFDPDDADPQDDASETAGGGAEGASR